MKSNTRVFRFKLYPRDDHFQKVYEEFLATCALRRYSFSVRLEWKSIAMQVTTVTVEDYAD